MIAAIVWIGIAIAAWHPATGALAHLFGASDEASLLQRIAAQIVAVVILAALAAATALTAMAVQAMPVIVRTVAARHFPALTTRHGGRVRAEAKKAHSGAGGRHLCETLLDSGVSTA